MVRISFGMIVLNGEPFIGYNLRSLYPYAHQIIVVEGAAPGASILANSEGHSKDNTLEIVRSFQRNEDPENKVVLITAEDKGYSNGLWPGEKDEQSQAYSLCATGDYLWQVDVDEFYRDEDIEKVIEILDSEPEISGCSFPMLTFWGDLNILTDGWYLRRGAGYYHRLFRWKQGYRYSTHRPPTVLDEKGNDLRQRGWITGKKMKAYGIYLYHYSLLFPKQVLEKCEYYQRAPWAKRMKAVEWYYDDYLKLKHPFRTHNVYDYPSWLQRFEGTHPKQAYKMVNDIKAGFHCIDMRDMSDVKKILDSKSYTVGRLFFKFADYVNRFWLMMLLPVKIPYRALKHLLHNRFIDPKRK